MELVYDRLERALSAAAEPERRSRALERALLDLPPAQFPRGPSPTARLALGTATPTAICWDPVAARDAGGGAARGVVLGFADGTVARWAARAGDAQTPLPSPRARVAASGVLSLRPSPDGSTIAVGSMDGRVALLRAGSLEVAASSAAHRKYAVALAWLGDDALVSGGWDGAVVAFRVRGGGAGDPSGGGDGSVGTEREPSREGAEGGSASPEGAPNGSAPGGSRTGSSLVPVARSDLGSAVTAVAALPPEAAAAGGAEAEGEDPERGRWRALAAVRGSHLLQELRPPTDAEAAVELHGRAGGARAGPAASAAADAPASSALSPDLPRLTHVGDVTLNATGDDHVSFSAVSLALSPPLRAAAAGAPGAGPAPLASTATGSALESSASATPAAPAASPALPSRLLAVATDSERGLVLDPSRGARAAPVLRTLHGVPTAPLASAVASWASDRNPAFGAPSGEVAIFAVADGRKVATLKAHAPQVVRALVGAEDDRVQAADEPWTPTLASVGFDRSAAAF